MTENVVTPLAGAAAATGSRSCLMTAIHISFHDLSAVGLSERLLWQRLVVCAAKDCGPEISTAEPNLFLAIDSHV